MRTPGATSPGASEALADMKRLRGVLAKVRSRQITSSDLRSHLKAVALAWFNSHRPVVGRVADPTALGELNEGFQRLLECAERSPATTTVRRITKDLQSHLVGLHTYVVANPAPPPESDDASPSFGVIPDAPMRQVLIRRWQECVRCLSADAPLAATVMMGGLLESLFLARVNREPNKQAVFTARAAPRDAKTGQPASLRDWTLNHYIDVAHEIGWITHAGRDVGQILRDYRNYIHPQKELSHQIALSASDARMLWVVAKALVAQIT